MNAYTFNVESIAPLWINGDGFLAGLPVTRLVLRLKPSAHTTEMTTPRLAESIRARLPKSRPKWLFLDGDEGVLDQAILGACHFTLNMLVYSEFSGRRPMIDRFEQFPFCDHACIRVRGSVPEKLSNGLLFHSIILPPTATAAEVIAMTDELDKQECRCDRYIQASDAVADEQAAVAAAVGRGWRVTTPPVRAVLTPSASVRGGRKR